MSIRLDDHTVLACVGGVWVQVPQPTARPGVRVVVAAESTAAAA